MKRDQLVQYLDRLLQPEQFNDYCPNGLQVEGNPEIKCLVAGVTASQALLDAATRYHADAILVHHGYFWKGENPCITGIRQRRIKTLLSTDTNLFAYHLPLDAHPELGNNAQLAMRLGWKLKSHFGEQNLGCLGVPPELPKGKIYTVSQATEDLEKTLQRTPLVIGDKDMPIRTLSWCTGGAQNWFEAAINAGADAFVTGEISEPILHLAQENKVAYFAAGHHATERYGVQSLAAHLKDVFNIETHFIDINNPA